MVDVRYVLVADRRFWGGKGVMVAVRAQASLFGRDGTSLGEEDGKRVEHEVAVRNYIYQKPHIQKCSKAIF